MDFFKNVGKFFSGIFGNDDERRRREEEERRRRAAAQAKPQQKQAQQSKPQNFLQPNIQLQARPQPQAKPQVPASIAAPGLTAQRPQPVRPPQVVTPQVPQLNTSFTQPQITALQNKSDISKKAPAPQRNDAAPVIKAIVDSLIEPIRRVGQAGAALTGYDYGKDLEDQYKKGKLTREQYQKKLAESVKDRAWVGTKDQGAGKRALQAGGVTADLLATILPVGSAVKAGKAAAQGGKELAKTAAKEAAINASLNAAGAFSEKDVTARNVAEEAAIGAGVGGAVPIFGRLISNARRATRPTPEVVTQVEPPVREGRGDLGDILDEQLAKVGINPAAEPKRVRKGNQILNNIIDSPTLGEIYKRQVDKARDKLSETYYNKGVASTNKLTAGVAQLPRLFGAQAGLKDANRQILRIRNDMQSSAGRVLQEVGKSIGDKVAAVGDPQIVNRRIYQVLETPEFLARKYGDGTPKLTLDDLTPQEREIFDQLVDLNKLRNDVNLETGLINQEQHAKYADGMHSPRIYDLDADSYGGGTRSLIDTRPGIKRKDLNTIDDEVFDKVLDSPIQSALIRTEIALRNKASTDALKKLDEAGLMFDTPPNKGFSRLDGRKYGAYNGKYVDNQIKSELDKSQVFNTKSGESVNNLIDAYRGSVFGKLDRFNKKTKTVLSPGTFLGNVLSNPLLFNRGAGVSAPVQAVRMSKAAVDLANHRMGRSFDTDIYEAQRYGVFSDDSGRALVGENAPTLATISKGNSRNPLTIATNVYGGVDDAAKLAIWRNLLAKGIDPETAARRVAQFTQDYANAGRLVQMLADAPVLGRPFARFAPELVRLVKNNTLYNPIGIMAGVAALAIIQNEMSQAAGETPEEREARETAVGQTLIPGTAWLNQLVGGPDRDLSMNFPINDASVNIARATGLNFPQEPGGDAQTALINQLMPWVNPTRTNAQGEVVINPVELISSLTFRPVADQIINRDFMGRTITDPENRVYYEGANGHNITKYSDALPEERQNENRATALAMNYLPFANEFNNILSAAADKEDYYGKERTMPQSVARLFGIKVESNSPEARAKRVDTKQYFEEDLPAVQQFVTKNPDLAETYFKLKDPSSNRLTGTKTSDLISPEKWQLIQSDASDRLFNFLKEQSLNQNQDDGRPVDPIYLLPPEQQQYVRELRTRPTGDDKEAIEILKATSDWYGPFEQAYYKYNADNADYFKKIDMSSGADPNPRVAQYTEASKPIEQPPLVKEYYRIKAQDRDAAKAFSRAQGDALSAQFDAYASARLGRINAMRAIEGYPPISPEVYANDTYGYDADGASGRGGRRGYGRGQGGGGSGWENQYNILNEMGTGSGFIKPLAEEAPPELIQILPILQKLMAGTGGRAKPKLGASSRGDVRG